MIKVKNITDEEHKLELEEMIHSYYDKALGPDWTSKIPFKKLRESLYTAHRYTKDDIAEIYGDKKEEQKIALGLYHENTLIGFASVAIFNDNVGGIFQLYIKPEYHDLFKLEYKGSLAAVEDLKNSLEDYFKNQGANDIIIEAPHTMRFLLYLAQDMGFVTSPDKEYADATELHKPLK